MVIDNKPETREFGAVWVSSQDACDIHTCEQDENGAPRETVTKVDCGQFYCDVVCINTIFTFFQMVMRNCATLYLILFGFYLNINQLSLFVPNRIQSCVHNRAAVAASACAPSVASTTPSMTWDRLGTVPMAVPCTSVRRYRIATSSHQWLMYSRRPVHRCA